MTLALFVLLPLVLSNILHMLVVRHDLLPRSRVPLSRRWFGDNKTLRGFILLPAVNGVASIACEPLMPELSTVEAALHGASTGLVYLLSELPTSFLKRRLGIAPGAKPQRHRILWTLLDKSDSVIGILLFGALVHDLPWPLLLSAGAVAVVLHLSISALLVRSRVKASL